MDIMKRHIPAGAARAEYTLTVTATELATLQRACNELAVTVSVYSHSANNLHSQFEKAWRQ
jgi:hypothetical protein